ncbi:hypothetical protein SI65_04129 [Aspergillus cristatus]|uniref:Rad21/Rec8-like protein N-terminal domain-containing protein n=1 Tax=Aspergillus cristatus TaxID=573508 RepID=A0A1E3BL12_ASPCR|nr:hypothetical protein SI65_04129 [Aspergillus cristatus]
MFYSYDILTSPEHGVATIWLVATLGSRSIAKRLNKKAILDVDVPRACNVITNPEAPMALRLQGSLLYGVSRVYSQQCGYTLTDVQAMHDRMRAMLKVLPGGGLDPAAGKARPDQLVLPDDPSFVPEINLPGLGIDFSKITLEPQADTSLQNSFLWTKSPDLSQTIPENLNLQLDLSSEDIMKDFGGFGSQSETSASVQRRPLGRIAAGALDEEAGVLLQPDFEFDEDGNIIELSGERERRSNILRDQLAGRHLSETPLPGMGDNNLSWDYQPMLVDDDEGRATHAQNTATPMQLARSRQPFESSPAYEPSINQDSQTVTARQSRRAPKVVPADNQTALRNTELAQMNNEYVQNMAAILKQKQNNKIPAQAKKNAVFWVFGLGIGSVGIGLGASQMPHPLQVFSGDELHTALNPQEKRKARKRARRADDDESDSDEEGRRVRAREEIEDQIGRGGDDVEIGRNAPPSLRDDNSQMPWNITASIQSSRHGSSANIFRGLGSVSELSSRGMSEPASIQLPGFGRPRSRLTSASPLAGRGFSYDLESLNGLEGLEGDIDVYGDFDLSHYLQAEVDGDGNVMLRNDDGVNASAQKRTRTNTLGTNSQQRYSQEQVLQSSLDQDSVNFLDFMYAQTLDMPEKHDSEDQQEEDEEMTGFSTPTRQVSGVKEITFSTLLPPKETTRTVATRALMHVLTLATKGFLEVYQEEYEDQSSEEHGVPYRYGEIFMRLP